MAIVVDVYEMLGTSHEEVTTLNGTSETRRRFVAYFSSIGLGGTLLPGVLWAQMQQAGSERVTLEMIQAAFRLSGMSASDEEAKTMVQGVNQNLTRYREIRSLHIPNNVSPAFHFSPIVPGMKVNRTREPIRFSAPAVKRPRNLEEVAFWPVTELAQLIKTRQATSAELTKMYLERLHKYNEKLNCVVTFLDDVAMSQAGQADAEIAAGKRRSPLHGIPWGAKDILAVKGYKTTWGSGAFKDQILEEESSVVEMLRDAGAVLLAKLSAGELASGDYWFGGQTKNPWNPAEGSGGSSAGPGSATGAGLVAFAIGTETGGSILQPSERCGLTGLRPTFGRVSRYGVMALSWTQDRLGPMCRSAEDCALVMSAIARPDGRDMSVADIPFNWTPQSDIRKLRVGYLETAFAETTDPVWKRNEERTLEQLRALGVNLVPVKLPDWTVDVSSSGVESGAFFDEMIRSGRDKQMTNPARGSRMRASRLVPAVEYVQSQRARMMMMQKLSEATEHVDVYITPRGLWGGTPAGLGPGITPGDAEAANQRRESVTQRHATMANLAGYPALAVPNGFAQNGTPTSITFLARPYGETELIALAKAYQDATDFHRQHPNLG